MVCQKSSIIEHNKEVVARNKEVRRSERGEAVAMKRVNSYTDQRRLNTIRNRIRAFADKRRYVRANLEKAKSDLKEVRMFVVERRDARTLVPIIVRHVKPGICNLYKRYNNSRTH